MEPDKNCGTFGYKEGQASLQNEALRSQRNLEPSAHARVILPTASRPFARYIKTLPLFFVALLCTLALSCGYTASTTLPGHIKTIAIPVFRNETLEYGIEEEITNALVERFVADNRLRVVGEKQADSVLLGTVTGYERRVFSYSTAEVAQEYEVVMKVSIEFKDISNGRIIWQDEAMVSSARYFAVEMAGQKAQTEQEGRAPAVNFLANDVLTRTVEGW